MNVRNIKIRVEDEAQCKAVQEYLFSKGCYWYIEPHVETKNLHKPFLFVDKDGVLTHSDNSSHFFRHENLKVEFDFETIIKATPRPRATTVLFGITYDREELQKALDKLTPVQA